MRGEKHPGVLEGTHGAVGLRRLLRPRPDVQTRSIQMCAPAPSRCARPQRADARQRPSRCAPPAHPARARASPAQMCTRARALQLCLLPQMCRCLAGGKLPAHPELIPGSSRAHPGPAASPSPSKAGTAGFSLLLAGTLPCGDRAAIPGFARGLSGEAGPPPCFPARCRGLPARPEMLRVPR